MNVQRRAEMASRIPDRAFSLPVLETAYRFAALDKPEQERSDAAHRRAAGTRERQGREDQDEVDAEQGLAEPT